MNKNNNIPWSVKTVTVTNVILLRAIKQSLTGKRNLSGGKAKGS